MNLYLKTLAGLEPLAADELKAAGATHIEVGRRGIALKEMPKCSTPSACTAVLRSACCGT